ncbi:MAG TPA: PqqD family protein [Anaerolineae bacterium]
MTTVPDLDAVYAPSEDVVARVIEGEIIIVPLAAGIGDLEDELYTLNDTGRAIWERLDGKTVLQAVIKDLAGAYQAAPDEIEGDVRGLVGELLRRRMIEDVRGH